MLGRWALPGRQFQGLWIYLVAPPAGMVLAAGAFLVWMGPMSRTAQATLHPDAAQSCIFSHPNKP